MSPRPRNIRKVKNRPLASGFIPIGIDECKEVVRLYYEEYEAIFLCDYEMRTQQEASESMGVSRPTLSRIYSSARRKMVAKIPDHVTEEEMKGRRDIRDQQLVTIDAIE